jgi:hypothetical protein
MLRKKGMRRCLIAVLVLLASPAQAGPFRFTGYDARSMGKAGTETVFGESLGVLYGNPALLVDVPREFTASFFWVQPLLWADLDARPANADVPMTLYDSDVGIAGVNLDRPLPTVELPRERQSNRANAAATYLSVGFATDFNQDDFCLALQLLVPTRGLVSVGSIFSDERDQFFSNTVHFSLFGEWSQVLSLLMGAAYRPTRAFSFGLAVEGSLDVGADLNMYIPEATVQDYALVNTDIEARPSGRLIAGVNYRPLEWLSFSLVWRDRRLSRVDANAELALWNYHEPGNQTIPKRVHQHHILDLDYEPMEATLSAGAVFGDFSVGLSVTWNHWAEYLDTHHQRPQRAAVLEPQSARDENSRFAFSDTFSAQLGAAWRYGDGLSATIGAAFHPTPVPAQVGRTNYLDQDKLAVALGHGYDFSLWNIPWRLQASVQLWHMFGATVHKDPSLIKDEFPDDARTLIGGEPMPEAAGLQTNNPGFPGFSFGGYALMGALSLGCAF